jgi:myo-inositol-1(or 4)-monophosphatase
VTSTSIDELLELAMATAREAGALLRARAGQLRTSVATKSTSTDMVSEVDHESEALIVARILAARPGDAVLGEEGGERPGSSGVRWIVDPLDGTTNYLYGIPSYAVSIGCEVDGTVVAGAVYDAAHDALYSAALGRGAFRDGEPIRVSTQTALGRALIGTGFAYESSFRAEQAALLGRIIGQVRDVRRSGSAALDLCAVACGRLDAYYETLMPWDLVAGALIVEEAGGRTGFLEVVRGRPEAIVAASPNLYPKLEALLRSAR